MQMRKLSMYISEVRCIRSRCVYVEEKLQLRNAAQENSLLSTHALSHRFVDVSFLFFCFSVFLSCNFFIFYFFYFLVLPCLHLEEGELGVFYFLSVVLIYCGTGLLFYKSWEIKFTIVCGLRVGIRSFNRTNCRRKMCDS